MPKFIDHHPRRDASKMSAEALEKGHQVLRQVRADIAARRADRFGVTPLNVYISATGESWCVSEAPSADAVLKSHKANGVNLSRHEVVEVTPLL